MSAEISFRQKLGIFSQPKIKKNGRKRKWQKPSKSSFSALKMKTKPNFGRARLWISWRHWPNITFENCSAEAVIVNELEASFEGHSVLFSVLSHNTPAAGRLPLPRRRPWPTSTSYAAGSGNILVASAVQSVRDGGARASRDHVQAK